MWKWYVGTTWYNNTKNHPWLGMVYTTYIYGDDWGWFSILPTWWICWSPPRVILTDFWKIDAHFHGQFDGISEKSPSSDKERPYSSPLSARTSLPKLRLEVAGPFLAGDLQKCPWNPRFFSHVKTSYSWDLRWILDVHPPISMCISEGLVHTQMSCVF